MSFTSDACWFLIIETLLIKNNKKREAALKMKRAGTRSMCVVFYLALHPVFTLLSYLNAGH